MAAIFISLRSEFYKFKKSSILWSSILFPFIIVALLAWGIGSHPPDDAFLLEKGTKVAQMQWAQYIGGLGNTLSTFLVPMFTIFIAYSVNDLEHKSDMWKSLFALPLSKTGIYTGKYLFAISLLLITMFSFYVFSLLALHGLVAYKPNKFLYDQYSYGNKDLQLYFLKFFLSSLGILGLQMTCSFLWKDFFKPMGVGLIGMILGSLWAFTKPDTAYLFPYSQPIKAAFVTRTQNKNISTDLFAHFDLFSAEIWMSLGYLLLFSILGFFIIAKRNTQ